MPASSANIAKRRMFQEVGDGVGVVAPGAEGGRQGGEVLGRPLGQLLAQTGRAQALWVGEDGAKDA